MKIARLSELKPYEAPNHYDMKPLRIHGQDTCGSEILTLGLSHFLPGGSAAYSTVPDGRELIYYILAGEMTVRTDKETFVLQTGESVFFRSGDGREVKNETNLPASMLVMLGRK